MAVEQLYPRASRFSKIMRALQDRTPLLTDIDSVRAPDLFGRSMMLIEQRTNGFKATPEAGVYTRDVVMEFARALSLRFNTAETINRKTEEDTQHRLWLQYAYPIGLSSRMRYRLIATVGNVWDNDVPKKYQHFAGASTLPLAWPALCAAAKSIGVYSRVVIMVDGRLSKGDEVLLCSPIANLGNEAVFMS